MQSGSGLCHWAMEQYPLDYAKQVAEFTGCPTSSSQLIVDCLRSKPTAALLRAQSVVKIFGEFPMRSAPVVERIGRRSFLPADPKVLLPTEGAHQIPIIIGLNKDETAYFYPRKCVQFVYFLDLSLTLVLIFQ